jgi:release factor glutamine methyltransferase
MSEPVTVRELLDLGERVLEDSTHLFEDHDFAAESEELLAMVLERDVEDLSDEEVVALRRRERFLAMIARRAGGEPFPFLTGHIDFYGLDLKVEPGAFVPRPSSELTVEWAERRLKKVDDPVVVDVCAGSAPIALAIAHLFPTSEVYAADISAEGLRQGKGNAQRLALKNIHFKEGDMFKPLPPEIEGRVDLITGHIPYVAPHELDDLPTEVREYEPVDTLSDSSEDGLFLMRHAIEEAPRWLRSKGWLLLEMADDLADEIQDMLLDRDDFDEIGIVSDEDRLSVVLEGRFVGKKGF